MLNVFLTRDVADIRQRYADNLLYNIIRNVSFSCCEIPRAYTLTPEQVFVEVMYWLDELKQEQQDVHWDLLYRSIKKDYRLQDKSIPENELDCIASTIVCILASILIVATPNFYHWLAELLMKQIYLPENQVPESELEQLMDGIETHDKDIAHWLDDYMASDKFLSNDFMTYFAPNGIEGKYIQFTSTATNAQRAEFKSIIKSIISQNRKQGIAEDIKTYLKKSKDDGVIILKGKEINIFKELQTQYGFNKSRSTFFYAKPKLTSK